LQVEFGFDADRGESRALQGLIFFEAGQFAAATDACAETLAINRAILEPMGQVLALNCLGQIQMTQNDFDAAEAGAREALGIARTHQLGDTIAELSLLLAEVQAARGDLPAACYTTRTGERHYSGNMPI
jgi:ATP/maltotriose-dependent transcriptional regulator MalT